MLFEHSWTSLTTINFLGKVRMWEEEKTLPIEKKKILLKQCI